MINGSYRFNISDEPEVTLHLTLSVRDWQKLQERLMAHQGRYLYPDWVLIDAIDNMLRGRPHGDQSSVVATINHR